MWHSLDHDPYEGDEVKFEIMGQDHDAWLEEQPDYANDDIEAIIKLYDCEDLFSYAYFIMWLGALKDIIGYIPFNLEWDDLSALTILHEEQGRKMAYDTWKNKQSSNAPSNSE